METILFRKLIFHRNRIDLFIGYNTILDARPLKWLHLEGHAICITRIIFKTLVLNTEKYIYLYIKL